MCSRKFWFINKGLPLTKKRPNKRQDCISLKYGNMQSCFYFTILTSSNALSSCSPKHRGAECRATCGDGNLASPSKTRGSSPLRLHTSSSEMQDIRGISSRSPIRTRRWPAHRYSILPARQECRRERARRCRSFLPYHHPCRRLKVRPQLPKDGG